MRYQHPGYSVGEEIANAVSHGIGALVSVAALTMMVTLSYFWGDGWCLAGSLVFGIALFLQYVFSTLYHSIPFPNAKHVFKVFDHVCIYLLIAGTYTPYTLITLRNDGGPWLFAVIWALAAVGILVEIFWLYRPKWVSVAIFVPMGWIILFLLKPIFIRMPSAGFGLLLAGGIVYTLGTVAYVLKKVKFMHAVWHLFVLGGSVCHFLSVLLYVLPGPAGFPMASNP